MKAKKQSKAKFHPKFASRVFGEKKILYFDNTGKFQPMKMVAVLQEKFPELTFDGVQYGGSMNEDNIEYSGNIKFIDTVLGHFIVQQLGDKARQSYVNETIKLFRLAIP